MDKETLSNYGWIVICVLVLAVMIALATPFGGYISSAVKSTTSGLFETNRNALNSTGLINVEDQQFADDSKPQKSYDGIYKDADGNEFVDMPETPTKGDTYEFGDYIYTYNRGYLYGTMWSVGVKDKAKTSYGEILPEIAGKPVTNMFYTFYNCTSLTEAPTIPNSVSYMAYTFFCCSSLTTAPVIPNRVTDMSCTFDSCKSLKTYAGSKDADGDFSNYAIPNNARTMDSTFRNCTSLTTAPAIPNLVTNMESTFSSCTSLTVAPTIPNSVTDMGYTFSSCTSLTTAPVIPNRVTDMSCTFSGCKSLKTYAGSKDADGDFSNYAIPNSVANMYCTFIGCIPLKGQTITIPASVTNPSETSGTWYNGLSWVKK